MSAAFKGMILYPLAKKKMGELLPLKGNTLDCCRSEICRSDTCWRTFVVSDIKKYVVVRIPARGIYSLSGETGHFFECNLIRNNLILYISYIISILNSMEGITEQNSRKKIY
jgi:hypothetical protein